MDEIKFKLSNILTKRIVSKLISKVFYKKYGYKVDIRINELDIWSIDCDTDIKLNIEAKLKSDEFKKILKSIDME